jgi:hypothetical protein
MPAEGHRELVEEADLAEYHLPRCRGPLAEEANLCSPFHARHVWLRSEPECHVSGMNESCLAADLQRGGMIRVRIDPDLSRHTRGGENSLSARVHQGEESRVIVRFRPGKRDADHWAVDDAAGRMGRSAGYVLDVREDPREGLPAGHAAGLPEANELGLTFLLGGHAQHAGMTDSLGPQSLEQGIRVVRGGNDLAALEGHPFAFEPAKYLG